MRITEIITGQEPKLESMITPAIQCIIGPNAGSISDSLKQFWKYVVDTYMVRGRTNQFREVSRMHKLADFVNKLVPQIMQDKKDNAPTWPTKGTTAWHMMARATGALDELYYSHNLGNDPSIMKKLPEIIQALKNS